MSPMAADGTRWSWCQMMCLLTLFMWLFCMINLFLLSYSCEWSHDLSTCVCVHCFAWLALLKRVFRRIKSVIQPDHTPASYCDHCSRDLQLLNFKQRRNGKRVIISFQVSFQVSFSIKPKVAITILHLMASSHISELIYQLICKDKCHKYMHSLKMQTYDLTLAVSKAE